MGALAFFAFLFSGGCAYHRVGWNHAPRRIVHVAPVGNRSGQAGIGSALWQQLIREISDCPGFATGSEADAEWILDVTIVDLCRAIGATSPGNSDAVRSYALTLAASCTITEKETGKEVLSPQTLQAVATLPTHPSFTEAKRQAVGQLGSILAKKICDLLSTAADPLPLSGDVAGK
jgi:hypothetical protein